MTIEELKDHIVEYLEGEPEGKIEIAEHQKIVIQELIQQVKEKWDEKSYNKGFRDGQDVGRYDVLKP